MQKLRILGGWQAPASKPVLSGEPRGKPSRPYQTSPKLHPDFLLPFKILSFGNCRRPLHHHPSSSASFPAATAGLQAPSFSEPRGLCSFQDQQGPQAPAHIHEVGPRGREHISPFLLFKSPGPNFPVLQEDPAPPPPQPIPSFSQTRLTGQHLPHSHVDFHGARVALYSGLAFGQGPEGGRRVFPFISHSH